MDSDLSTISIIVTIVLAFLGWLVTHHSDQRLARRKERLDLVDKRLNEFYGPLYVATKAGDIAHEALLTKLNRTESLFYGGRMPPKNELDEWFLWMENVFMPLNDLREQLILHNAYLIREETLPKCLLDLVTHVVGYRVILAKWKKQDYLERNLLTEFPKVIDEYAERSYLELKREQAKLIGLNSGEP